MLKMDVRIKKIIDSIAAAIICIICCLVPSAVVYADVADGTADGAIPYVPEAEKDVNPVGETDDDGIIPSILDMITGKGEYTVLAIACILAAVIAAVTIALILRKRRMKAALEKGFDESEALIKAVNDKCLLCSEELLKAKKNRETIEKYVDEDDMKELFSFSDSFKPDLLDTMSDMNSVPAEILAIKRNRNNTKDALKSITVVNSKLDTRKKSLDRALTSLREERNHVNEVISDGEAAAKVAADFENSEIRHNVIISDISGIKGATGTLSAKDFAGKYIKGGHKLDDVKLLGAKGSLGNSDNLGRLNLYVYGIADEDAVCIRSTKEFEIRAGNNDVKQSTSAKLYAGSTYMISIDTEKGKAEFKLTVQ